MKPATWPRDDAPGDRLLHLDLASGSLRDARIADLPPLLRRGDVLVVNDAATLPASLQGHVESGASVEARLVGELSGGAFRAVLFGPGDWRTPTEHRGPPPVLRAGDRLSFGELRAAVVRISSVSPRLVELRFEQPPDRLWPLLYRFGRPVQYSYAKAPFEAWHVQVPYASQPWAAEMPSAGRPLRWEVLLNVRQRGVAVASITHAAGLSSTGDPQLDALLPFAEPYKIPLSTASMIEHAQASRRRIIAIGTTVVRALEHAAAMFDGAVPAGEGLATQRMGASSRLRIVDAMLTGTHDRGSSHYDLLRAFVDDGTLRRIDRELNVQNYRTHEFGDSVFLERADDEMRSEGQQRAAL